MIAKVFLNWEIRDDQSIPVKWVIIYKHRGQSIPYIQPCWKKHIIPQIMLQESRGIRNNSAPLSQWV